MGEAGCGIASCKRDQGTVKWHRDREGGFGAGEEANGKKPVAQRADCGFSYGFSKMCGFIAWFQSNGPLDPERRRQLSDALKLIEHRGPDDTGEASGESWFMGFQRLSILDLSPAGHQPMRFGNGRFTLTFNGEIYNYRLLKDSLTHAEFRSTGDTEVLGNLLLTKAPIDVLQQLRGMFAFAWHDEGANEVVAARDHFGIKPLYFWYFSDGTLLLSSELRVMRYLAGDALAVNRAAVAEVLRWGSVEGPATIYEGVKCLPPGHLLRWRKGQLEVRRYFAPEWERPERWIRGAEAVQRTKEIVSESVKTHLVSDVPVGVFLSGGLDSTLLAALMREQGMQRIKAFSIGYSDDAGVPDETDAAFQTAQFLGCDFHRERISAASLLARLDEYFASLDQPTGDALNTWLVSRVAACEVKVALSGLGADEWFAGYNYHRVVYIAQRLALARSMLGTVTGSGARVINFALPDAARTHKLWKLLFYAAGGAGQTIGEMHAHARSIFNARAVTDLTGESGGGLTGGRRKLWEELDERAPGAWLNQLLLLETQTYLADTLLRDNDVTSMAHSLELRVPLVDREVFRLAAMVAPAEKLSARGGKHILRKAFQHLLPPWIADDRAKKTFTLPLMKWMREPGWRDRIVDTLSSQRCRERGWLRPDAIEKHVTRYYRMDINDKRGWNISQSVWLMFVLESWAQMHFDSVPKPRMAAAVVH